MKALFDIRGRQLVVETDASVPAGIVRVHSLDSFAGWISALDGVDGNGEASDAPVRDKRRAPVRRPKLAEAEALKEAGITLTPKPKGGWKDGKGARIVLGNYASREAVAVALARNGHKLDTNTLAMLAQRFGLGAVERPHSFNELIAMYKLDMSTISKTIATALKRIGVRLRHKNMGGE